MINETSPRLEDVASVGTRIRWGAIVAGGMLALGVYFLLAILGAAVGLSISDRQNPTTLTTGAVIWALVSTCVALFVGGMIASLFTVGENKVEALVYGVIMWSLVFTFFVSLSAAGARTGFSAMVEMSNRARAAEAQGWDSPAREAGTSTVQIDQSQSPPAGTPEQAAQATQLRKTMADAAPRLTWYAFAVMWLSMLAAAGGALVGAGPTFRLVTVTSSGRLAAAGLGTDPLSPIAGNGQRATSLPLESKV